MKYFAKTYSSVILVIGIILIFCSLNMDATVDSGSNPFDRIYNNGLLNERTNFVIVSCFVALIGAMWVVLGGDKSEPDYGKINEQLLTEILKKLPEKTIVETSTAMEQLTQTNNDKAAPLVG